MKFRLSAFKRKKKREPNSNSDGHENREGITKTRPDVVTPNREYTVLWVWGFTFAAALIIFGGGFIWLKNYIAKELDPNNIAHENQLRKQKEREKSAKKKPVISEYERRTNSLISNVSIGVKGHSLNERTYGLTITNLQQRKIDDPKFNLMQSEEVVLSFSCVAQKGAKTQYTERGEKYLRYALKQMLRNKWNLKCVESRSVPRLNITLLEADDRSGEKLVKDVQVFIALSPPGSEQIVWSAKGTGRVVPKGARVDPEVYARSVSLAKAMASIKRDLPFLLTSNGKTEKELFGISQN